MTRRALLASALCAVAAPASVTSAATGELAAALQGVLDAAVARRAFPGAVAAAGRADGPDVYVTAGRLTYAPDSPLVVRDTIYDLASLTKVVGTTTLAMVLVDEGTLRLTTPVSHWIPEFHGGTRDQVTVAHLLTHSAGFDWWAPLYKQISGAPAYLLRIATLPLVHAPGTVSVYSDLGIILLGTVLERAGGAPLDVQIRTRVTGPLGMTETGYRPDAARRPRIAPTEQDPWRGRLLQGEVHDENAHALGGVAAHAGLFGTAPDLVRFARMMLGCGVLDGTRLVESATVDLFTRRSDVPGSSRALGWDTSSGVSSSGDLMSARAYGHTGFTGTSLWIDPVSQVYVLLLTNRVHPDRSNDEIRAVRRQVLRVGFSRGGIAYVGNFSFDYDFQTSVSSGVSTVPLAPIWPKPASTA